MESKQGSKQNRKLVVARRNSTKPGLLSLNNKCLVAICLYLPVECLSDVAATCNRLFFVAREAFVMDAANKNFTILSDGASTKQYLQNFGDLLDGISKFFHGNDSSITFDLVIKYCSGTLKQLKWQWITFTPALCERAHALLGNLTTLELTCCDGRSKALAMCRRCEIVYVKGPLDNIIPFLEKNQRLKKLTSPHITSSESLAALARLQHLEVLELFLNGHELVPMRTDIALSSPLRSIVLHCFSEHSRNLAIRLLASPVLNNSLEILDVFNCIVDSQFLATVARFDRLHTLKLRVTVQNLEDLNALKDVRHLEELIWRPINEVQHMQRLLEQLGSTATLKKLKIEDGKIDGKVIKALSRFQNLTELNVESCRHQKITEAQLAPLGQLQQLHSITIYDPEHFKWLKYLGCTETLTYLNCYGFELDARFFSSLGRFAQLRVLGLRRLRNMTNDQLMVLDSLVQLEELDLRLATDCSVSWRGLIYVLQNVENLRKATAGGFSILSIEMYERIMKICRRSACQLIVYESGCYSIKENPIYDEHYMCMNPFGNMF